MLVGASSCVEETLVLGDDRSRHACMDALTLVAPESGCTTVTVESTSPYGCIESDGRGTPGVDHAGSWVRLSPSPDRGATIQEYAPKLNRTPADLVRLTRATAVDAVVENT